MSIRPTSTATLLVLLSTSLLGADPDPFIGTWKLNWDKSHTSDERPKSAIRRYKKSGSGVRVSEIWEEQNGKRTELNYVAGYDGKDYPVGPNTPNTVSFTRLDSFTVQGVSKTNGKIDFTFKRFISKDGKTLTIELIGKDSAGAASTRVLVYDKLK